MRLILAGLASLAAFFLGAATSAVLINWGRRRGAHSRYALPLVLEAALLLAFGLAGARLAAQGHIEATGNGDGSPSSTTGARSRFKSSIL